LTINKAFKRHQKRKHMKESFETFQT